MNFLEKETVKEIIESIRHLEKGFTIKDVEKESKGLSPSVIKKYIYEGTKIGIFNKIFTSKGGRQKQTVFEIDFSKVEYFHKWKIEKMCYENIRNETILKNEMKRIGIFKIQNEFFQIIGEEVYCIDGRIDFELKKLILPYPNSKLKSFSPAKGGGDKKYYAEIKSRELVRSDFGAIEIYAASFQADEIFIIAEDFPIFSKILLKNYCNIRLIKWKLSLEQGLFFEDITSLLQNFSGC